MGKPRHGHATGPRHGRDEAVALPAFSSDVAGLERVRLRGFGVVVIDGCGGLEIERTNIPHQ